MHHFLIEGWNDTLDASSSDAELMAFLEGKGAVDVHAAFVAAIKSGGKATMGNAMTGYYSSSKIIPMMNDTHTAAYASKGITAAISKVTVNLGQPAFREFLWVELIDAAAAGAYTPGNKMSDQK